MTTTFRAFLLAGAATLAVTPAFAQARKAPNADPRITQLEQQLRNVQLQLADIKAQQSDNDYSGSVLDLKRSTSDQYVDINKRLDTQPKASIDNGRFTIASANGAFSLSLRSLIQFDAGYFSQGKNPASVDLNSGTNFRRAQLGLTGTAWKDWSYNFTYDFGGNGVEKSGYIYSAYIQYDGFKPFGIRIGAFTPSAGIEDQTGSADLIFLERPAAVDVSRNIAGSPSREGISIFRASDDYFLSASYTTKKATDAATFDGQQAVIGRAAWLPVNTADAKWLVDGHVSHVFDVADTAAGPGSPNTVRFSNGPEVAIDSFRTIDTGNIDAKAVTEFGFETAATWDALYVQGGWFHQQVTRRTLLPNPDFSGWYAAATWSLTGEQHRYDPTTASFRGIRPAKALGADGFGAWELKARYSSADLDYLPFTTTAAGGIGGGKQDVWTLGVNWYVTDGLRFALDYDNIQVNHVNAPTTDISASAVTLRSQLSL